MEKSYIHVMSNLERASRTELPIPERVKMKKSPTSVCTAGPLGEYDIHDLSFLTKGEKMQYVYFPSGKMARYEIDRFVMTDEGFCEFDDFLMSHHITSFDDLMYVQRRGGGVFGFGACDRLFRELSENVDAFGEWIEKECPKDKIDMWVDAYQALLSASELGSRRGCIIIADEPLY